MKCSPFPTTLFASSPRAQFFWLEPLMLLKKKYSLICRTTCTTYWMVLLFRDKLLVYLNMFSFGCTPFNIQLGVNKCWGTVSMTEHLHNGYYVLLAQQSSNKLILSNNFQAAQNTMNVHPSYAGLNILLASFYPWGPVIRLMGQ